MSDSFAAVDQVPFMMPTDSQEWIAGLLDPEGQLCVILITTSLGDGIPQEGGAFAEYSASFLHSNTEYSSGIQTF